VPGAVKVNENVPVPLGVPLLKTGGLARLTTLCGADG